MVSEEVFEEILRHGPTRVVIDANGAATTPSRAREQHKITPDVIFVRDDNWSLGAPAYLEQVAYDLWANEWIGALRRNNDGYWERSTIR